MALTSETDPQTLALLRSLVSAFEDKKAENLTVLRVSAQSNITDYLVLATGNSEPHLRALRVEAEKVLDAAKVVIAGMDQGGFGSGWTVVDAYQIMIHFFTAEQRENYALEKLWRDAEVLDLKAMAEKPKAKPAGKPKAAAKSKAAAKPKAAGKAKAPAATKKAAVKASPAERTEVKVAAKKAKATVKVKPAASAKLSKTAKKPAAKKSAK